jgi:hypothetical protein
MADLVKHTNLAAYDEWEKQQQNNIGIPLTPTDASTGLPRDDTFQKTVRYSTPITKTGSDEIACPFESNADTTGKTIITEDDAKTEGFIESDEEFKKKIPDDAKEEEDTKKDTEKPISPG